MSREHGRDAGAGDDQHDEELLADLFDALLQDILDGHTPDLDAVLPDRPDLRERIERTWNLACSVAGRRRPGRPVFAGYEILRELGHGGMGTVYLARHHTLRREVALKVLPQSLAMAPGARERFVEEARALARLRHQNVVHVHHIVDHEELLAFEMEFVDGPSLQQLLVALRGRERPFDIATIADELGLTPEQLGTRHGVEWLVRLSIRIARALDAVHRLGLVHRDVKPANILLRQDGTPLLADFGLALTAEMAPDRGKFAGTPVYAAPERLRGDERGDGRAADIYSLGATLHEALTLSPPFQGTTTEAVLQRIGTRDAQRSRERAPHISRDLATIIDKAMDSDPRHRYPSADAFADDLQRLLNLEPIRARPAGPLRRATKFVRRHQKAAIAACAGALLVALVAWPLAALAAGREADRAEARRARHAARTALLSHEALPSWWHQRATSHERELTVEVQRRAALAPRLEALRAALAHYDAALRATPDDGVLRAERDAVQRAVAALDAAPTDAAAPRPAPAPTEPGSAASTGSSRQQATRADDDAHAAASPHRAFADGLTAFLTGDRVGHERNWSALETTLANDAFVEACIALRQASEQSPERAYPRVFHAARAYPDATALVVALAEAAVRTSDLELARQHVRTLAAHGEPVARPRRLLEADLLAATGDSDGALESYRHLQREDPSDPRPLMRIAYVSLRLHDFDAARRVCRHVLDRWSGHRAARRELARLCLLDRDVAGYLTHVREALLSGDERAADELLRCGGLRRSIDIGAGAYEHASVPLQTFLSEDQVAGVRRVVELLPTLDALTTLADRIDPRPVGAALLTPLLTALRFPTATASLPRPLQCVLLAALPTWGLFVPRLSAVALPYQRVLGNRLRSIERRPVLVYVDPAQRTVYGHAFAVANDLDGDTLPDLCIAAPPSPDSDSLGFVDCRRQDGTALATWSGERRSGMFARSIAVLGDVDGDLCDDVLIGTPLIQFGTDDLATIELRSGRTGARIWSVGREAFAFGAAIAAIDDVDGDGMRDVAAGVPPMKLSELGRVDVLSGADGHLLHELHAPEAGTWFGAAVCRCGDLDGDGIDDVLVGGNYGNAGGTVVAFDARGGEPLLTLRDADPQHAYATSVSPLGDIDGDGTADFAVGCPGSGTVALISGRTGNTFTELRDPAPRATGLGQALQFLPDWRGDGRPVLAVASHRGGPTGGGFVRVFDLASAHPLQTFAGATIFGYALADLGDLDRDGLRDLGIMAVHDNEVRLLSVSHADLHNPLLPR